MKQKRIDMPCLDASTRINNFSEVATGYTNLEAINEASRCLNCKDPSCVKGCPVNVNIPSFINEIKKGNLKEANRIINENNLFGRICGRVCPQENQCEKTCVYAKSNNSIAIGNLERYVSDNFKEDINSNIEKNGFKVAIVGSGPSGMSCAFFLAKNGFDVTIFESLHEAGGVLRYGIPEFRLPKDIVDSEINKLLKLNVKIRLNTVIGKTLLLDDLRRDFDFIYIATGAGLPKFLNIEGENLKGVYSANEFLTRINLSKAYKDTSLTPIYKFKNICVIGGGNVAMDAARCAKRLNPDNVYVIYRRTEAEMPARKEEIKHAKEEKIEFLFLNNPLRIIGDDDFKVKAIECIKMELSDIDESGRRKPIEIPNSNYLLDVDCVILALGNYPNPILSNSSKDLKLNNHGLIIVDDSFKTSIDNIYAGGDIVTGAATVISAMGAGKEASNSIINAIKNISK